MYYIEFPVKKENETDKEYEIRVKANENYLNQMLKEIVQKLEQLEGG